MEPRKKNPSITESLSEAAEKAASRMRQLQSRLHEPGETAPREAHPSPAGAAEEDTVEAMEQELREMFARAATQSRHIRARVVEEAAERIFRTWDLRAVEDEVAERLVERVLERLNKR